MLWLGFLAWEIPLRLAKASELHGQPGLLWVWQGPRLSWQLSIAPSALVPLPFPWGLLARPFSSFATPTFA